MLATWNKIFMRPIFTLTKRAFQCSCQLQLIYQMQIKVTVTFLVVLLSSDKFNCQDNVPQGQVPAGQPPPPVDQNAQGSGGGQAGQAGQAPPPPGGPGGPGPGQATPNERIFPNLKNWVDDLIQRMSALTQELTPNPNTDDPENMRKKKEGLEQLQGIDKGVKDPKLLLNKNQREIAAFLTEVENKLVGIGRRMFGIRWNSIPCGAGYVHAMCGQPAPCPPPG